MIVFKITEKPKSAFKHQKVASFNQIVFTLYALGMILRKTQWFSPILIDRERLQFEVLTSRDRRAQSALRSLDQGSPDNPCWVTPKPFPPMRETFKS